MDTTGTLAKKNPQKDTMNDFATFRKSLNSLKCKHAIVLCGQKVMYFILTTLMCGGTIENVKKILQEKLVSKNQYKNSFTSDEHKLLDEGEHQTWDVSLLYKIIQKICGLEPCGSQIWTTHTSGEESLEYLIYTLKVMRNKEAHNFGEIISVDEMDRRLTALSDLALRLISALGARAQILGRQVSDMESNAFINTMFNIVNDVREKINEGQAGPLVESVQRKTANDEDMYESDAIQSDKSELQFDNVYVAAGAGGQTHQESLLQKEYADLTRKFWLCAGLE